MHAESPKRIPSLGGLGRVTAERDHHPISRVIGSGVVKVDASHLTLVTRTNGALRGGDMKCDPWRLRGRVVM